MLGKLCDTISGMKIYEEDEAERLRAVDIVMTEVENNIDNAFFLTPGEVLAKQLVKGEKNLTKTTKKELK